jgi:GMP synthase (glutamine-hydrolysing)
LLHVLLVEGNARTGRDRHAAAYGCTPAESYAAALGTLAADLAITIVCPADADAALPSRTGLADFDAAVLTGSGLNAYDAVPEVTRQVDLMSAVYAAGLPAFGSCWGLQIGAIAAGGTVTPNPRGPEVGFARRIVPSTAGADHPLLAGRPAAYDAPAVHLDVVADLPPDATVLAGNAMAPVQAAEIRHAGGTFWGVQYHPEFALDELAAIVPRYADRLAERDLCRDPAALDAYAEELRALHAGPRPDLAWRLGLDAEVLDPACRMREIANFLAHRVRPAARRRGRG